MDPKQQRLLIGYFLVATVMLILMQSFVSGPHTQNVSYSEFNDLKRATDLANDVVTTYGMGDAIGLAVYDNDPTSRFLDGAPYGSSRRLANTEIASMLWLLCYIETKSSIGRAWMS